MIRTAVNKHASHHKDLTRLRRFFDHVQCLIKQRAQPLAVGVDQLRDKNTCARRVRFPTRPRYATMLYRLAIRFEVVGFPALYNSAA